MAPGSEVLGGAANGYFPVESGLYDDHRVDRKVSPTATVSFRTRSIELLSDGNDYVFCLVLV